MVRLEVVDGGEHELLAHLVGPVPVGTHPFPGHIMIRNHVVSRTVQPPRHAPPTPRLGGRERVCYWACSFPFTPSTRFTRFTCFTYFTRSTTHSFPSFPSLQSIPSTPFQHPPTCQSLGQRVPQHVHGTLIRGKPEQLPARLRGRYQISPVAAVPTANPGRCPDLVSEKNGVTLDTPRT